MRAESWKAIRIPESTRAWRSWDAPIMPDSPTVATVFPPAASAAARTFSCLFSPTRFHEDPLFINAEPGAVLTGRRREFCRTWRNQTEVTLEGIHFIQEDSPEKIGEAVGGFVRSLRSI